MIGDCQLAMKRAEAGTFRVLVVGGEASRGKAADAQAIARGCPYGRTNPIQCRPCPRSPTPAAAATHCHWSPAEDGSGRGGHLPNQARRREADTRQQAGEEAEGAEELMPVPLDYHCPEKPAELRGWKSCSGSCSVALSVSPPPCTCCSSSAVCEAHECVTLQTCRDSTDCGGLCEVHSSVGD